MEDPKATRRRAWLSAERGALVVMLLLMVVLLATWWVRRGDWRPDPTATTTQPDAEHLGRIDPNTASWQTLACLEGIGEARAKAIVQYRDHCGRTPAFTKPDDLRHDGARGVPGIGPKTVELIEPFLVFPSAGPDP